MLSLDLSRYQEQLVTTVLHKNHTFGHPNIFAPVWSFELVHMVLVSVAFLRDPFWSNFSYFYAHWRAELPIDRDFYVLLLPNLSHCLISETAPLQSLRRYSGLSPV